MYSNLRCQWWFWWCWWWLASHTVLAEEHRTGNNDSSVILERQKRQLLFPVATLLQVSFCVATKVQLGKDSSFFINQGFQLNFALPNMLSQIPNSFLNTPPVINGRSRTKREQEQLDKETEVTSEMLYFFVAKFLENYGYNGTDCMLHSVCELAKIPFHKDEDLLHELVHFIMTPSEHGLDKNSTREVQIVDKKYKVTPNVTSFKEYLNAEALGKSGADCDIEYKYCPTSPLSVLSEIAYEDYDNVLMTS